MPDAGRCGGRPRPGRDFRRVAALVRQPVEADGRRTVLGKNCCGPRPQLDSVLGGPVGAARHEGECGGGRNASASL
jgi:hypothetical protein